MNCSSRSFVVQVVYDGVQDLNAGPAPPETDNNPPNLTPDVPTVMDRAMWTTADLRMFHSGRKLFFRGVGLITPKQLENPQYRAKVLARHARRHEAGQQTTPVVTLGEYVTLQRRNKDSGNIETQTFFRPNTRVMRTRTRKKRNATNADAGPSTQPTTPESPVDRGAGHQTNTAPVTSTGSGTTAEPSTPGPDLQPVSDSDESDEDGVNDGFEDDNTQSWSSDTVPVRVATATFWKTKMETNIKVPYSPMFTSITERLSDPAATGALGSMTRGPSVVDAASVLALAKYTASSTTSILEVAAVVRLGCLIMSVSKQCYSTEIIMSRMIRGWHLDEYLGFEIAPHNAPYPNIGITAIPLDVFISHCFGKSNFIISNENNEDADPEYSPLEIDNGWTAVPIKMSQVGEDSLIPYIVGEIGLYKNWYNNSEFRALVAALDMFWCKFPENNCAGLRVCTLNARFKDCSSH